MRKILLLGVLSVLILSACTTYENSLKINSKKINLIGIADSSEKSYLGLSFRDSICDNCGMLFPFEQKVKHSFVMRDMLFPLDIVWIDGDEIVKISKNLPPEGHDFKNIYNSDFSVNNVLEVNGNFCDENNIKVGDKIEYNLTINDE